jgi:hypothetical protein
MSLSRVKRGLINSLFKYWSVDDSTSTIINLTDEEAQEIFKDNYLSNYKNSIQFISMYDYYNKTGKNYFQINRCDRALLKYDEDENNRIFWEDGANWYDIDINFNYIGPSDNE